MNYQVYKSSRRQKFNFQINRHLIFLSIIGLISLIIIAQLFSLQVIAHDHYAQIAAKAHYGYSEIPAHRGEIFIKDYASGDNIRIATNSTLYLLFADPTLIKNKKLVADRIAPMIFNLEQAKIDDQERVKLAINRAKTAEEIEKAKPYSDDELYQNFYNDILEKISADIRPVIILSNSLTPEKANLVKNLNLPGIQVNENNSLYAYPPQIIDYTGTSEKLSTILEVPSLQLSATLKGRNRYVVLAKKLTPELTAQIKDMVRQDKNDNFTGLGFTEEYYRYYPENELAANVLGFVASSGEGNYGIEEKFNTELKGQKGIFQTQKDSIGRLITVGDDTLIKPAQDGKNYVLTLDRSVQMAVEARLKKAVNDYRADSGQVIVMDPKTGRIIALAHYPSFNPNNYGTVYEKEEIKLTEQQITDLVPVTNMEDTFWLYRNFAAQDRLMVFKKTLNDGTVIYEHYKNNIGPEAYQNKIVSEPYEPGSIFKPLVMAIAIDDGIISPSTYINDSGILKVDEYEIKNVSAKCTGRLNMAQVLAQSCNTGMGWIAQKMGRSLFYNSLKRFGFGERTEIEFDNEHPGKLTHSNQWADSELVTHAFGQGLTVTPIQMIMAIGAIANNGVEMQPFIIDSIEKSPGNWVYTEPTILGQMIKPETAKVITEMMIGAVEEGVSSNNKMKDYIIAAKTGTAQTYRNGKPLSGAGTTFASVVGYGPVSNPKFVILAKLDRPRSSEWADNTTSNLFKSVAEYLFEYYSYPPDRR